MSNERLEVLGGLPLFEPLSPDERERLAVECRMRRFARGAALFREGERADGMHIVLRGVVKVVRFATDGREMVLHLVRGGNTIGEAAMFQKGTFPASAVAVDDVETLFLPAEALFALVTETRRWPCGCSRRCRSACGCSRTSWRRRGRAVRPVGLPRICCTEGRSGAGTASGSAFRGKCSPTCLGWPVKRFPASCPGSPRRAWSS